MADHLAMMLIERLPWRPRDLCMMLLQSILSPSHWQSFVCEAA